MVPWCALFCLTRRCQKNKQAWVPHGYYPFTNLRVVYFMRILIAERIYSYSYTLCVGVSYVMASIGKEKNGSKKIASRCPYHSGLFVVGNIFCHVPCLKNHWKDSCSLEWGVEEDKSEVWYLKPPIVSEPPTSEEESRTFRCFCFFAVQESKREFYRIG